MIKRETDEFVLTPEIAYFINDGPLKKNSLRHLFFTKEQLNKNAVVDPKNQQKRKTILDTSLMTF